MRRAFLLSHFILACFFSSYSQKKDETAFIVNADDYEANLIDKSTEPGKISFKNIVVYDLRYDTSKIGYVFSGGSNSPYSRIKLKSDWTGIINDYFSPNLDPGAEQTLVFVIRTFWMQKGILDEIVNKKVIQKEFMGKDDEGGVCFAGIDIFIKTDSLVPFFKIDAPFFELKKFKPKNLEHWFYLPLDSILRKIASYDMNSLKSRKKLALPGMLSYYRNRFSLPVLKETSFSRKGVYLTFEDFKNNKITETDFRIANGALSDELYTKNGKQESMLAEFWGCTDGKDLFIKVGFSIYKAARQQNSFEVYGGKHVSNYHNNPAPGQLIRINSMSMDKKILQLNMDTGKFY